MNVTKKDLDLDLDYIDGTNWGMLSPITLLDYRAFNYIRTVVTIEILVGFIFNGASAGIFKAVISSLDKRWAVPSAYHDALYANKTVNKWISDLIFFSLMCDCIKVLYSKKRTRCYHYTKAFFAYLIVTIFGWRAWYKAKQTNFATIKVIND